MVAREEARDSARRGLSVELCAVIAAVRHWGIPWGNLYIAKHNHLLISTEQLHVSVAKPYTHK